MLIARPGRNVCILLRNQVTCLQHAHHAERLGADGSAVRAHLAADNPLFLASLEAARAANTRDSLWNLLAELVSGEWRKLTLCVRGWKSLPILGKQSSSRSVRPVIVSCHSSAWENPRGQ